MLILVPFRIKMIEVFLELVILVDCHVTYVLDLWMNDASAIILCNLNVILRQCAYISLDCI